MRFFHIRFVKTVICLTLTLFGLTLLNYAKPYAETGTTVLKKADEAPDKKVADKMDIDGIFREIESFLGGRTLPPGEPVASDIERVRRFFSIQGDSRTEEELLRSVNSEKLDALKGDIGLKFTGSYLNNIRNGVLEDERSALNDTMYIGLEWEVLKEGFLQRRLEQAAIRDDISINTLLEERSVRRETFQGLYYRTIYDFNLSKIGKLRKRIEHLDTYIDAARKLFHYRLISWEEVIRLEQEKAGAENMLSNYLNFNRSFPSPSGRPLPDAEKELPILDIDIGGLIDAAKESGFYERLMEAEGSKFRRPYDPILDANLRLFARYYMDDIVSGDRQDSVAAGVSLRIPLPLRTRGYEKVRAAEERLSVLSLNKKRDDELYQIQDTYYEYRYKLNDYRMLAYKKALVGERLRREGVKRRFRDPLYSPVLEMQFLDDLYAIDIEALEVKQQLYLKLLNIYRFTSGDDLMKNVAVVKDIPQLRRYRGERSVYIWSEGFNGMDNDFLGMYLKQQGISEIMVSFGGKTDEDKLRKFIAIVKPNGVGVHALIGANELVHAGYRERLKERIGNASAFGFAGIHLDVEPQTLPDWGERKGELLSAYLEMLRVAKDSSKRHGIELSISIPVFFPADILKEVFSLADRVYVMAYEITDVGIIKKRLAEEIAAGREKVVIAIRTKDFENRLELEEFSERMINETGVNRLAIHDLKGMVELDEKGVMDTIDLLR